MSSKQYPEGRRQKSGAKGKEKNNTRVSCSPREKQRHERTYRKGVIVGKSSSHHSKKGRSREVALGVEVAHCNERKEQAAAMTIPRGDTFPGI